MKIFILIFYRILSEAPITTEKKGGACAAWHKPPIAGII